MKALKAFYRTKAGIDVLPEYRLDVTPTIPYTEEEYLLNYHRLIVYIKNVVTNVNDLQDRAKALIKIATTGNLSPEHEEYKAIIADAVVQSSDISMKHYVTKLQNHIHRFEQNWPYKSGPDEFKTNISNSLGIFINQNKFVQTILKGLKLSKDVDVPIESALVGNGVGVEKVDVPVEIALVQEENGVGVKNADEQDKLLIEIANHKSFALKDDKKIESVNQLRTQVAENLNKNVNDGAKLKTEPQEGKKVSQTVEDLKLSEDPAKNIDLVQLSTVGTSGTNSDDKSKSNTTLIICLSIGGVLIISAAVYLLNKH
jgi:hypothetical protein